MKLSCNLFCGLLFAVASACVGSAPSDPSGNPDAGDMDAGDMGVYYDPDVLNNVMPGCNTGSDGCHSPASGSDLSTYTEITTVNNRIDLMDPANSLFLTKMAGIDHGGGEIYAVGSTQYNIALEWIEQGAKEMMPANIYYFDPDILNNVLGGCTGCHSDAGGTLPHLETYAEVLVEVDLMNPAGSPFLTNMIGEGHAAGEIYALGSTQYTMTLQWIQGGALETAP